MIAHPGIILAIAATIIYNLGFIGEKRALDRLPAIQAHRLVRLARTLFASPAWLAGFLLICGGLTLQVLVLSLEPLTVAQPLQASGVVVTIGFSRLMLRERLGRAELGCVGVIAVAAVLLGLSGVRGPGTGAGTHAAGAAIAAAALPVCLAVPLIYHRPRRTARHVRPYRVTGLREACCAGLVYGFAGIALKGLSAAVFATPRSRGGPLAAAVMSPYLYLMLVSAAAGMCLFQVALQRSPASMVMPMSLVISTGYLLVIGSWLFHERLPASPVPLAMRVGGAVAAVAMPVILTVISERKEARRFPPAPRAGGRRREPDEPGYVVAEHAGLPD